MRLIRDQQAYFRALSDFVEQRASAADFMTCFHRLWERDGAAADAAAISTSQAPQHGQAGLHATLQSINALCDTFARSLPPGCGYRVSEEQFRKEVHVLASALPVASLERS